MLPMTRCLRLLILAMLLVASATVAVPSESLAAPAPPRGLSSPVTPDATNLTVGLSVSTTTIEAGFQVWVWCNVSGGIGSVVWWLNITGYGFLGSPNVTSTGPTSIGYGLPLSIPGNQTASLVAIDSTGARASALVVIRVLPDPRVLVGASETSLVRGQDLTISALPTGGVGPWRLFWLNLPPGCPYGSASVVTCTPTAAGTWTVTVTVVDAWGVYGGGGINITVREAPALLGMPAGQAVLVVGGLAILGAAGAGLLILWSRRKRGPPTALAAAEPKPPKQALPEATKPPEGKAAAPPPPPPSWWGRRQTLTQKALLLALLAGSGAVLYATLAAAASVSSGFSEVPGYLYLALFLGLAFLAVAWRVPGPLLAGAGLVAGLALYFALAQPLSACTTDPVRAATLGVATCGTLTGIAVAAGVVAACVAGGAVGYLVRWNRAPRRERALAGLGVLVVTALVMSSAFALAAPPPVQLVAGPVPLPFPLPAGSAFTIPLYQYDPTGHVYGWEPFPQMSVPVTAAGGAQAILVGGWNSTASVCIYVGNANYAFALGPPMAAFGTCGTNVTFAYALKPAGWMVQLYIDRSAVGYATVRITQTFELVY